MTWQDSAPGDAGKADTPIQETISHGGPDRVSASAQRQSFAYVGPYLLLRVLGEGGMGQVWLAEQAKPVKRQVALKLIRGVRSDSNLISRFHAERQILAMMDHPSIAKVYDAGSTEDGQPYFAMEYVPGLPISQYCDRNRLSTRDRVSLFLKVCEGVQHAHQKAILHRDLKPNNILVVDIDGGPVPRIIDFGLARMAEDEMQTRFTQTGMMLGTPGYMSPEQAEGNLNVDTRTDIYSLGVVFYELLTGALPIETSGSMLEQIQQLMHKEPATPSSRIRSLPPTASIAMYRGTSKRHLVRLVRGDLDSIAIKALEKDRERRYGSVSDFANDLRRYLRGEAVEARAPSTGYRARKFLLRHRLSATFTAVLAILLVALAISMTVQARRVARERDRANLEAETARRTTAFLSDLFTVPDPDKARGNSITAREILDKGASEIRAGLRDQPAIRSRLMATMGDVYAGLGLYSQAEPLLVEALDLSRSALGPNATETLHVQDKLAWLRDKQGRYADAEKLLSQSLQAHTRDDGPDAESTLRTAALLGAAYYHLGRYNDADKLLTNAVEVSRRKQGESAEVTLSLLGNLAITYDGEQQIDKEAAIWQELYEKRERMLGTDSPTTITAMQNLAYARRQQHRYAEAEKLLRAALANSTRVVGAEHPTTLQIRNNLANVLEDTGRLQDAEKMHRDTLAIRIRTLGEDNPDTLFSMNNLANVLVEEKKYDEAATLYQRALHGEERVLGANHPEIGIVWYNLARVEAGRQHRRQALAYLQTAMDHGWTTIEDLDADQEWRGFSGDSGYKQLVSEIRKRSRASTAETHD